MFGIAEKIMAGIIVALLVIIVGVVAYYHSKIEGMQGLLDDKDREVAELKVEALTHKNAALKLSTSLKVQNFAVEKLEEVSKDIAVKANAALKAEKAKAIQWQGKYAAILNAPKQGSSCDNLHLKMSAYFMERHREAE